MAVKRRAGSYLMLSVTEFGRQLITTGDLDPVYIALLNSKLDKLQLKRWLVTYWCFYDCGFSSWASEREGRDYWQALLVAAANTNPAPGGGRWPRAKERRHFRGAAAIKAVELLRKQYTHPEDMVNYIISGSMDIKSIMQRAQQHYLYGGWIAFKMADMIDAVLRIPVDQSDVTPFLYNTPRKSIETNSDVAGLTALQAMNWLRKQLYDYDIPHKPGKSPDNFCLETIWCKHYSHRNGHYPLLNDIREINHGLQSWVVHSKTAEQFKGAMPKNPS